MYSSYSSISISSFPPATPTNNKARCDCFYMRIAFELCPLSRSVCPCLCISLLRETLPRLCSFPMAERAVTCSCMTHASQPVPFGVRQHQSREKNLRSIDWTGTNKYFTSLCMFSCLRSGPLALPSISVCLSLLCCVLICCCCVGKAITKRSQL